MTTAIGLLALAISIAVTLVLSVFVIRLGLAPLVRELRELRTMFEIDRELADAEADDTAP